MSQLVIKDLLKSDALDHAARVAIYGGISFGWISPYFQAPAASAVSPLNVYNVTNNFIEYTQIQQLNPINIMIDNSGGNTGSIVNNITATPVIAAANPALVS